MVIKIDLNATGICEGEELDHQKGWCDLCFLNTDPTTVVTFTCFNEKCAVLGEHYQFNLCRVCEKLGVVKCPFSRTEWEHKYPGDHKFVSIKMLEIYLETLNQFAPQTESSSSTSLGRTSASSLVYSLLSSTPLIDAAKEGNLARIIEYLEILKTLLDLENIDINLKDDLGRTALGWAASKGHISIVQALLNHEDILVNVAENHNSTPIGLATEHGHVHVVELLVWETSSEFINKADNDGDFPLQIAAWKEHEKIVEVLLRHPGIDLAKRDIRANRTALEWAREKGNERIAKMLEDAQRKQDQEFSLQKEERPMETQLITEEEQLQLAIKMSLEDEAVSDEDDGKEAGSRVRYKEDEVWR